MSDLIKTKSKCLKCGQEFFDEDANYNCVYAGSLTEPPEWDKRCPHCNSIDVEEISIAFCRSCNDVVVSDYGEQCSECYTCEREALFDAMMDR